MSLEYLELGARTDPVVLLLHGFPDHPPSFVPVADNLAAAGFRAIVPWMRGYGPSVRSGPYHSRQLAADVIDLCDRVSPSEPCFVVGHDWGAIATLAAVAIAPDRFAAAVIMSVPHLRAFTYNIRRSPGQLRRSAYIPILATPILGPAIATAADLSMIDRLWRAWSPGFDLPETDRRALKDCLRSSMPAPVLYYRALPQTIRFAASRAMRRLRAPVLYLHGSRDGCCSVDMARGQDRFFSSIESRTHSGVGHFLHLEDPDAVSADILEFLTRAHM